MALVILTRTPWNTLFRIILGGNKSVGSLTPSVCSLLCENAPWCCLAFWPRCHLLMGNPRQLMAIVWSGWCHTMFASGFVTIVRQCHLGWIRGVRKKTFLAITFNMDYLLRKCSEMSGLISNALNQLHRWLHLAFSELLNAHVQRVECFSTFWTT